MSFHTMSMRQRTVGLSRNQSVPSILSTVNGRKINRHSPQGTPSGSKAASSAQTLVNDGGDEETPQLHTSSEDEASIASASRDPAKVLSKRKRVFLRDASPVNEQSRSKADMTLAMFNPPPASSDSEEDSGNVGGTMISLGKDIGANLLADSDSEDDGFRRGDLRPTKFVSRTSQAARPGKVRENGSQEYEGSYSKGIPILRSSQASGLSQPTSSAGSHFENVLGHVRKHKAKQTYSKPKPQATVKRKKSFEKHDLHDSPIKTRAAFNPPEDSDDSASSKQVKAIFTAGSGHDSDFESIPKALSRSNKKRKGHSIKASADREEKRAKPTFFIPEGSPDRDLDRERPRDFLRPLSSSSLSDPATSDDEIEKASLPTSTLCPWCGKSIKPETLKGFANGKRLSVQMQTRFCRSHQKQSAKEDWQDKGYPDIDWVALPERLAQHHDFLLSIVNGKPTDFRDALAEDIRLGKSRTLRQEENLNPGYYGPRGFNLMCDFLVAQFGDLLKERAVNDRVIAGRGSAAFIQAVLVAELAVQLIKEDMRIGDAEARAMFHESKELGELVHDEA